MRVQIKLDEEYTGPTILEIRQSIPNIEDNIINVLWNNSKDEIKTINQFDRDFMLFVPDVKTMEKTIATFGKKIRVPLTISEKAKSVLTDPKNYDWRKFTDDQKYHPKYILMQLAANAIRKGISPPLADIVSSIFIDGVSPVDADVLLRLKSGRIRG